MDPSRSDADPAPRGGSGPGREASTHGAPFPGVSLAPEHDWSAAAALLYPVLRPAGTIGTPLDSLATPMSAAGDTKPVIDPGPADLVVAYAISAAGFDILASGDHVAAWSVSGRHAPRGGLPEPRRLVGRGALVGGGGRSAPDPLVRHR